nr:inositol monophosphatase [Bradyrhizobium japonicum]
MPVDTELMALMRSAEPIVTRAATTLVEMQRGPRATTRKELRDIVTDADLAAEKIVIDGLRLLTPGAAILSEEAGFSGASAASRWIIDPLDGTVNYAAGLPWFSVSAAYHDGGEALIGLVESPLSGISGRYVRGALATINGEPARVSDTRSLSDAVVSVILTSHFQPDEVRTAAAIIDRLGSVVRGVRIVVSGALEMAWIAAGQLDAFVSVKSDLVSHAAAMPLLRAANGRVTTIAGADSQFDDLQKIATNGHVHDELLTLLQEIAL